MSKSGKIRAPLGIDMTVAHVAKKTRARAPWSTAQKRTQRHEEPNRPPQTAIGVEPRDLGDFDPNTLRTARRRNRMGSETRLVSWSHTRKRWSHLQPLPLGVTFPGLVDGRVTRPW